MRIKSDLEMMGKMLTSSQLCSKRSSNSRTDIFAKLRMLLRCAEYVEQIQQTKVDDGSDLKQDDKVTD